MLDEPNSRKYLTRRRFLRMGMGLPAFVVSLSLPVELLAAPDVIGGLISKTSSGGSVPRKKPRPEADAPDGENTSGVAPSPGKKPRAPRLLMLDPGHGGHDPGAIGKSGIKEKDITLDIAKRMMDMFATLDSVNAKLTRDTDEFIPLPERVKIAQEARADLFISIHADSAPNISARGLSAYTLSEKASDDFANALARQENRIEAMGGVDIDQTDKEVAAILMDLTARRTRNTSQRVRQDFVRGIGKSLVLLERPMRAANFAVLRAPDVPSVLVETGFLSNPRDESILRQPAQRQKVAASMAKEISLILNGSLFS